METEVKTKRCWGCKTTYPATPEFFHRNCRESTGLHGQCKICKNKKNKIYASKHRVFSKPRINHNAINNHYIWNVKEHGCCVCCGEQRPETLAFHHREPEEKLFGLSDTRALPLSEIKAEITKCDLMCANCHTSLHYWEKHR